MTPGTYIALARDIGIVLALGFLVWRIYSAGEDRVKVADVTALQAQLTKNAAQQQQWRDESNVAAQQLQNDLANVHALVAQHTDPIVLRVPARGCSVSNAPAQAAGSAAASGGPDTGSGIDLRPQISAFELKYEAALTGCRAALREWPQ